MTYAQIHEEHNNSLTARTTGAIALRPTDNTQDSHNILNIDMSRWVAHNNWMALPLPNELIHAMYKLMAMCKKHKGIVFTDKYGNVEDDNSLSEEEVHDDSEITGMGTGVGTTQITGVDNTETDMFIQNIGVDNTEMDIGTYCENTPDHKNNT